MFSILEYEGDKVAVSDDPEILDEYRKKGYPAVLVLNDENRSLDTHAFKYAVLNTLPDEDYLRLVIARHKKLPLKITETNRLIIRELALSDAMAIRQIYDESEGYLEPFFDDPDETEVYLQNYIDNHYDLYGFGLWGVTLRESQKLIGICGFTPKGEGIELGYGFLREYRKRGLAAEAALGIIEWGILNLDLKELTIRTDPSNTSGMKLAKKLTKTAKIKINNI